MTEAEWLAATAPDPMLLYLRGKSSSRKLRLLACAFCRRIWSLLENQCSRDAVEAAEAFADQPTQGGALAAAPPLNYDFLRQLDWYSDGYTAAGTANATCGPDAWAAAWNVASEARRALRDTRHRGPHVKEHWAQVALLRHIMGNPFRPYRSPPAWPSSAVQLAEAMYAGEDVYFALSDALEETGYSELAAHFREPDHPKGCWALDVILGRS